MAIRRTVRAKKIKRCGILIALLFAVVIVEKIVMTALQWLEKPLGREEFTYLRTKTYTCGTITRTVKEYRHDQTGMEFVLIPGQVKLSPYLISKTEVTQGVWKKIMGNNPSEFKYGDDYPVEQVYRSSAQEFCEKTGLSLPTEAQWQYAARGGSTTKWYHGDSEDQLKEYAWYNSNSRGYPNPVGRKKPNAFGLYDMSGNVREWTQGGYNCGGSWYYGAERCSPEHFYHDHLCDYELGFRVCANSHKVKKEVK